MTRLDQWDNRKPTLQDLFTYVSNGAVFQSWISNMHTIILKLRNPYRSSNDQLLVSYEKYTLLYAKNAVYSYRSTKQQQKATIFADV